jgi:hypothetical protein
LTTPPDKSPDSISGGKSIEPTTKSVPSGKPPEGFDTHMQGKMQTPSSQQVSGPTPMDVVKAQPIASANVSLASIDTQAKNAKDSLGIVEKQLKDPNLKLKRSQSHLVKQKLGDANAHIQAAASKLGAEAKEDAASQGLTGIPRFLAMVNHGQDQLMSVHKQIEELSKKGPDQINPGEMMSIQVKMGLAQQEIEYTSVLLSKVIQSITQIINTQL